MMVKRLVCVKKYRSWTVKDWKKIIFSDETHLHVQGYKLSAEPASGEETWSQNYIVAIGIPPIRCPTKKEYQLPGVPLPAKSAASFWNKMGLLENGPKSRALNLFGGDRNIHSGLRRGSPGAYFVSNDRLETRLSTPFIQEGGEESPKDSDGERANSFHRPISRLNGSANEYEIMACARISPLLCFSATSTGIESDTCEEEGS
ncbi:hypothetical protein TNCV_2206411 [Trichonephila clavipes]|uniref:Uncharacterized protein n=1 Tax=Trichonephila clavipes TaxID=2585209 RepID=A0A8X6VGI2_TRICX|nr:hypothetical protein TNCV_2206411 [Trichonephila clavipes]